MKQAVQKEINDLFDYGYKIYQIKDYFKFASDSVLLSEFVKLKKKDKEILDLCTGNAPVPMILTSKYGDKLHITGIELQKEIYDLAIESLEYNKLTNIDIINDDVNNCLKLFRNKHFDVITCNPPYFKHDETRLNNEEIKAIARHEIKLKLEDIIKISSKLLNTGGYLYMVHRPERLSDVIIELHKYGFGLKRIVPVYNDDNSRCVYILFEAMFKGEDYVKVLNPITLHHDDKTYKDIFKEN
jgi:tRNA1(Val) A37 N6-methylase TrmN6